MNESVTTGGAGEAIAVELVLDAHATIGESPTWCAARGVLFWIDVKAPALHCFNPADGTDRRWVLPSEVGCFAINAAGTRAVLGLRSGLFEFAMASGEFTHLAPPPFDPKTYRFNEGACDSTGRFWLGTMFDPHPNAAPEPKPGALHSYSPRDGLRTHADVALIPNGMAWSLDGATMYIAHSLEQTVFAFPFEARSGSLGSRGIFVTIPKELGIPDGAALDTEGCYWCAIHKGGRLRRYRPDGQLDREIMMPVDNPTMCAFAGPDLDQLYITSATHGTSAQPHEGGLFRCRPGVRGVPRATLSGLDSG